MRHHEALKTEAAQEISELAKDLISAPEATVTDGVVFDAFGKEADNLQAASTVGTITSRVIEVKGVPVGIAVKNYREEPVGLRMPPSVIMTDVIFSEPITSSAKQELPVQITAVQTYDDNPSQKQTIGASARYKKQEKDGSEALVSIEREEELRILQSAIKALRDALPVVNNTL